MRLSRSPTFWKYQGGGSFSPAHSVGVPEPGSSSPHTDLSGSGMSQLSSQWTLCSVPSLPSLAAVELAPCSQVLHLPTMTLDEGLPALGWPSNLLHCRDPHQRRKAPEPLTGPLPYSLHPPQGPHSSSTHQGGAAAFLRGVSHTPTRRVASSGHEPASPAVAPGLAGSAAHNQRRSQQATQDCGPQLHDQHTA